MKPLGAEMINNLHIGDLIVFKDGRQGLIDKIRAGELYGFRYCDYHLDFDFWVRWIPEADDANKKTVELLGIAKVVKHET